MRQWWRDWRRGWSDYDLACVLNKLTLHECNPGAVIYVTERELNALVAYGAPAPRMFCSLSEDARG